MKVLSLLVWLGVSIAFVSVSACASAPAPEATPPGPPPPQGIFRFLPLEDGTVSTFETEDDLGETGIFMLEIERPRPELAELRIAGRVQRLSVDESAALHRTGGALLRLPLERGATFAGSFGRVTVTDVEQTLEVPAGRFTGCVLTREETSRPPRRVDSAYCPGVGLTRMVVEGAGDEGSMRLEARLRSHEKRTNVYESNGSSGGPAPSGETDASAP